MSRRRKAVAIQPHPPRPPCPPTVFEVWWGRDFSWSVWELRSLLPKAELKAHFAKLGFERRNSGYGRIISGPCTECESVTQASLVDSLGRCPDCRPSQGCPKLAREREASLKRQEARARRGDPLRRCYFKQRHGPTVSGASLGSRRRGRAP